MRNIQKILMILNINHFYKKIDVGKTIPKYPPRQPGEGVQEVSISHRSLKRIVSTQQDQVQGVLQHGIDIWIRIHFHEADRQQNRKRILSGALPLHQIHDRLHSLRPNLALVLFVVFEFCNVGPSLLSSFRSSS